MDESGVSERLDVVMCSYYISVATLITSRTAVGIVMARTSNPLVRNQEMSSCRQRYVGYSMEGRNVAVIIIGSGPAADDSECKITQH